MLYLKLALLTLTAAFLVSDVRSAEACSGCTYPEFTPANGATVPANIPYLYWRPGGSERDPTHLELSRTDDPLQALAYTAIALDGDYLVTPTEPLVEGASYRLAVVSTCIGAPLDREVIFTVGPAAPLPTQLGTLSIGPNTRAESPLHHGSACSLDFDIAYADITLELSAEALPWKDALFFGTTVDGEYWLPSEDSFQEIAPGASWRGRGVDRVYTLCDDGIETAGVSTATPGDHQIVMEARLPGTDLVLTTAAATASVSCESTSGGCSTAPGASGWGVLIALAALLLLHRRRLTSAF